MITLLAISAVAAQSVPENGPAAPVARSAVEAGVSAGFEYQEGNFGAAQRIETSSIPFSAYANKGRLQFGATLPYLRVDAPGNVVGGGGGILGLPIIVDPTEPPGRVRREGIGDLELGAAYTIPSEDIGLTFSGQVKVPTASTAKRLGTGEFDYALGAELSRSFGRVTPFVGVGYTMPGDPEHYDLGNSLSARAGAAVQMGKRVRGHVTYGYAESISPLIPDEQQISTGINAGLSDRLSLGLYGAAGLSKGSPDVGAGVRLGTSF